MVKKKKELSELDEMLKGIEKTYGAKVQGYEDYKPPEPVSTGSILLDRALGIGGLPSGRIVELFGPESSGKSSLAYTIIGAAQRAGHAGVWVDAENVHTDEWAAKQGVDVEALRVIPTVTDEKVLSMEEILGLVEKVIASGLVKVLVIDSVSALVPEKEFEQEIGDQNMSLQARVLSQALRRLLGVVSKTKSILIFINQLRDKPGVMFGNPETTPGGRALKFYSSVRLDVRRLKTLGKDEKDNPVGHRMKVRCVKNKVAAPFREAEFDFYYTFGVDRTSEVLDAAIQLGIVKDRGHGMDYNEGSWRGRAAALEALRTDNSLFEEIREKVLEGFTTTPAAVVPEVPAEQS